MQGKRLAQHRKVLQVQQEHQQQGKLVEGLRQTLSACLSDNRALCQQLQDKTELVQSLSEVSAYSIANANQIKSRYAVMHSTHMAC